MYRKLLLLGWLILGLVCLPLAAQRTTGSVVGIITDASGAAIPNANIIVLNVDTGISRSAASEASGNYRVPSLTPGRYKVSAETAGFRTATREGITLQVDQDVRVDFALQVGDVKQELTITAAAPTVNTENGAIGAVISNKQILELPLNGRNLFQLPRLTPGVAGDEVRMNVNGSRPFQQEILLDGGTEMLPNLGNFNEGTPILDSVEEFKVQTNGYAAEFGRGAAVVNVTTKGGTNQLHGDLYEFFRNDKLNANSYFNNLRNRPRGVVRLNTFGGTIGGPIRKDKTFFFFLYEGERQRNPAGGPADVPTSAMRAGNFSAAGLPVIFDPSTSRLDPTINRYVRTPFAGNIIPTERIDPVARKAMTFFPDPNFGPAGAFAQNMLVLESSIVNSTRFNPRIDHKFSDKHFLFGRLKYQQDNRFTNHRYPANNPADPSYQWQDSRTRHFTLSDTYILTPRLVNDVRFTFWRGFYPMSNEGMFKDYADQLGIKNSTTTAFPVFSMGGLASYQLGGAGSMLLTEETTHFGEAMTYTRGSHSLKYGVDLRWSRVNNITGGSSSSGSFSFSGVYTRDLAASATGTGLADGLLGLPNSYSITTRDLRHGARKPTYAWYIQDDWKVNRKLTLNLGLRHDLEFGWTEVANRYSNFDPNLINPYNGRPGALIFAGENGAPTRMTGERLTNFAPRFGLAYAPFGDTKTVIRAGGGFFFAPTNASPDYGGGGLGYVSSAGVSNNDQVTPIFLLKDGPPPPTIPPHKPDLGVGQGVTWRIYNVPTPAMYQYNVSIARELPGAIGVEASYVAQRGVHLLFSRAINQLRTEQLGPGDITQRKPWPQYSGVTGIFHDSVSSYNSFQLKVEKRFAHGFTGLLAYTLSKSLDNSSLDPSLGSGNTIQTAYDTRSNWGPSAFDIPQNLVVSFNYELPFGPGRSYLNGGWQSKVLGGWQMNGISFVRGGQPYELTMATNLTNSGANSQRPDRIRDGGISNPTIYQWFDTGAFVSPGNYKYGNAGRNFLRGDGVVSFDLSLFKNTYFVTPLNERSNLQFRVESFNAFNQVNFSNPNGSVGGSTYGMVTGTSVGSRTIQLALKFIF